MCNELAGRVPHGGRQRISGHARPVSFVLPSGRCDWDPMTEVLPLLTVIQQGTDLLLQ